jgi:Flp pilus assembly protein CpaB
MEDSSRRRRFLLMTLGVVLALIAGGATLYLAQSRPPPTVEVERRAVVVATRDIDPRTELALEDLRVVELPEEAVLPQAFSDISQAEGRRTTVRIHADQQLTEYLFIGTDQDPLAIVPPEIDEITDDTEFYRAVSISVPRNRAVAGQLTDGDRVDLLVTVSLATPLQPIFDENGNITYQAVEHALPVVDPETGELKGIVGGQSTKITIPDLVILRAQVEEGLYILRVNLNQAEQINHIIQTAPDAFSLVLRPGQDTRTIDPELYGETTDAIIMNYVYQVPFLVDLDELLGFPIEPIEGLPTPVTPTPSPEPQPEPPPDDDEDEEP